jgi:hypothetical protein
MVLIAGYIGTSQAGFEGNREVLPVINRNEISGDGEAFKWLSIKYFLDFSTH